MADTLNRYRKHSAEFRAWQRKFYRDPAWEAVRVFVMDRADLRCESCGRLDDGTSQFVVDHIVEIDEKNKDDWNITLNPQNLQWLCADCHAKKHAKSDRDKKDGYEESKLRKVGLF